MKTGFRVILFLIISMASILMFYIPYLEIKQKTTDTLNERQMLLARQAAFGIESFFREQSNMLHHFATSPSFMAFTENATNSIIREFKNHNDLIRAITVYDDKGIIQYSYPNPEKVIGKDISDQAHVKKILTDHKTGVSDVFNAVQGYQAVALSEPMFSDGRFVGVVAFLIDFKHIAKTYLEGIQIGKDGYAWMISRDGTELYCPVPGHTGANVSVTSAEFPTVLAMTEQMQQGHSGITTYHYDKIKSRKTETIKKYAVYYPVRVFDNLWSITVATPESEVYSELRSFYRRMLFSMTMVIFALTLFGYTIIKDYNLSRINDVLQKRVDSEMEKRKQQEKLMLQQARFYSMGETLNAIAHQWRQPLNSIGLCVQDIEDAYRIGQLDDEYVSKMVNLSMQNLRSLSRTIDDFRSFFAPNEKMSRTNICSIVQATRNIFQEQFEGMNIDLQFESENGDACHSEDCDLQVFDAEIYPDILKQVILNCLQNSREAVTARISSGEIERGIIKISIRSEDKYFIITITDNGGGMPEDILEKIYDPYFTTKDVSIGMGLGLYISRNILEEHLNGSLVVENYEEGARVLIRFRACA